MRALLLVGVLALLSTPTAQGPAGTATVRGRIVDGSTGRPVPNLTVRFSPRPRLPYAPGIDPEPPSRSALTTADGTFEVSQLAAADYVVYADSRGEYLSIEYGASGPGGR